MRNRINIALALAALFAFALIACDDGVNGLNYGIDTTKSLEDILDEGLLGSSLKESELSAYAFDYSSDGPDVSQLLGWQWGIEASKKNGFDFKYLFKSDGSVSYVHCCGYTENDQGCYFLYGDLFILYLGGKLIQASNITIAENRGSFTWNGEIYPKRDPDRTLLAAPPLALSNKLVGKWKEGGTEFEFGADGKLRINSDLYGYMVWKNEFLTIGPLVDGQKAGLDKYRFSRPGTGSKLLLKRASDDQTITLNLAAN